MDRYIRYTPSHRLALLRQLPGRRLTRIVLQFPTTHGGAPLVHTRRAFGHADGMLTLGLSGGCAVDVTGFVSRRSMLIRLANPDGFTWTEHRLLRHPDSIDLTTAASSGPLADAIGKAVASVRILRSDFDRLAYRDQPSDAGLELELEDGQRLILSQLLTRTPGVLTVSTPDALDPEIARHLESVGVDSLAAPPPPALTTVDPFQGAPAAALRDGRAILSSSLLDYDIFADEVVTLDTPFAGSPSHVEALAAIRSALVAEHCSVTDIRFYLDADGTVALAAPLDVVQGVAPAIDLNVIDALTEAIAGTTRSTA